MFWACFWLVLCPPVGILLLIWPPRRGEVSPDAETVTAAPDIAMRPENCSPGLRRDWSKVDAYLGGASLQPNVAEANRSS